MKMPLLLTSSIDPNNCSFTERKSIDDRKNDYMNSLFKWLTNTDFDIVYIDNSNYDLTFLKKTFENYGDRIEFLSFNGNNFDRSLGKSYGELEIIKFCLENSTKFKDFPLLIKSTGRYYHSKVNEELINLKLSDYDFVGYLKDNIIHTGFLAVNKIFLLNFIKTKFNDINPLNDSNGYYMEHFFYDLCFTSQNVHFMKNLGTEGISGTFNCKIDWIN
jgi:hypothetical protein